MQEKLAEELIRALGGRYSAELGIDLEGREPEEIFKWFLAAILFGARISEDIAARTYHELSKRKLTTPEALLRQDWDGLVEVLDLGGYVRYDFKTATKLHAISAELVREYQGDLNNLHEEAADPRDLERKLMRFKGIGPVTVNIFLREMRGIWEKADPLPSDLALLAAQDFRLVQADERAQALEELKGLVPMERLADLEAALVRLGKNFCRKGRHLKCPMASCCPSGRKEEE